MQNTNKKLVSSVLAVILVIGLMMSFASVASAASTGKYTITASSGVNVRAGPGTGYSVLTVIPYGKTVTVTSISGNWGKTTYNSKTGWFSLTYAKQTSSATTISSASYYYPVKVTASSGLNMRSSASANASKIAMIPYGTTVTVIAESNGWGKVVYGNNAGWVMLSHTVKVSKSLSVPIIKQTKSNTCGSACGAMVLRYLGKSVTEIQFYTKANANGEGTYVYSVKNTLNYYLGTSRYEYTQCKSLSTSQYYGELMDSLAKNCPVIVPLRYTSSSEFGYSTNGHYVVVKKLYSSGSKNYCVVNDPKLGVEVTLSVDNLFAYNKAHSGYIISCK